MTIITAQRAPHSASNFAPTVEANAYGMNDRIKRLRQETFEAEPSLSIERALIETRFYKENYGKYPIPILRAMNFYEICKQKTIYIGKDELIDYQNQFVSFKGMTVEAAGQDESGNDVAFLYNYDGSGSDGDDLYFNVSLNGETYTFTVESYLCDNTTDVYKAVKELKIGDKIDMEGFLYWYEGVNPHITSVTAAE